MKQSSKRYEHSPADREVADHWVAPLAVTRQDPAWLGGMPQNIGGALGLHRIAGSDIRLRAGLTARWNSGTRQDDGVIWFKCYSKTTNSDCVRSYNRSGARGQQGR